MMTIVTHVRIREGQEPAWDEALRERVAAARERIAGLPAPPRDPVGGDGVASWR